MDKTFQIRRFIEIRCSISCLTEVLGYAKGQKNIYNQLDLEGKDKYEDLFTLKDSIEDLQIAINELGFVKTELEKEVYSEDPKKK